MTDFQNLSETELQAVIEKAEIALKNKKANNRKEVLNTIKELADSINVRVEIHDIEKPTIRPPSKIPVKYRHPKEPGKTWTGRGMTPKWIKVLLEKGHNLSDFKI